MNSEALEQKINKLFEKEIFKIEELYQLQDFPMHLWRGMAEEGLLGLNTPRQYEGLGLSNKELIGLFEKITSRGFPIGLVLSWLTHLGLANFLILPFATKRQREFLLPKLAKGEITLSLAFGEMGSGGSPGKLKTKAELREEDYIINGKKDFITNGNIADMFAVFPVTGEANGKKEFSGFLIPKTNQGLTITKPMDVRNLNPSLHCSVLLKDCIISDEDRIGDKGKAYEQILKPWREYEDIYLMGALIGAMKRQLAFVRESLQNLTHPEYGQMEKLYSTFQVFRTIVYESAFMLDEKIDDSNKLSSLVLSARNLAMAYQEIYEDILLKYTIKQDNALKHVTGSIRDLLDIAKGTIPIRQKNLGKKLIHQEDLRKGSLS